MVDNRVLTPEAAREHEQQIVTGASYCATSDERFFALESLAALLVSHEALRAALQTAELELAALMAMPAVRAVAGGAGGASSEPAEGEGGTPC